MARREEAEDGVLLYYKYASVPDLSHLFHFYDSNCKSLGLLGRVRIAPDGVNVTVKISFFFRCFVIQSASTYKDLGFCNFAVFSANSMI